MRVYKHAYIDFGIVLGREFALEIIVEENIAGICVVISNICRFLSCGGGWHDGDGDDSCGTVRIGRIAPKRISRTNTVVACLPDGVLDGIIVPQNAGRAWVEYGATLSNLQLGISPPRRSVVRELVVGERRVACRIVPKAAD